MSKTGIWRVLDIEPTADTAVIRKAYAARLKLTNPEVDAEGFMALRRAYDAAMSEARWRAYDDAIEAEEAEDTHDDEQDHSPDDASLVAHPEMGTEARVEAPNEGRAYAQHEATSESDDLYEDEDSDPYDHDLSDFIPLPAPRPAASFPATITPAPDAARTEADIDADAALRTAHRLACTQLLTALNFSQPPAAIRAAFEAAIRSPAMDELGVHVSTEQWIANLLHQRRPASDCLIDRAIAYFGWNDQAANLHGDIGSGILSLRSRIADEKVSQAFIDRIGKPAHEYHRAFVVTTKPMQPRPWWQRILALRQTGVVKRFLAHVDTVTPAAIQFLDASAVHWWRTAIDRLKLPQQILGYLWRAGVALLVLGAIGLASDRSDENGRTALFESRRLCTWSMTYEPIASFNPNACADAAARIPDSLLMQLYAGIEALHADNIAASDAHFSTIEEVSPNDYYALFGQGLAYLKSPNAEERDAGVDMIATARRYEPEVDAYFARFDLTAPPTPTTPAPVIAPPYKRATPPPAFDVAPKRHKSAPPDALKDALTDFGFGHSEAIDSGYARLQCLSRLDWSVSDCRIVAESPKNEGRAELALRIASKFQYEPATLNGEPVDYAPVNISIVFEPPASPPPPQVISNVPVPKQ